MLTLAAFFTTISSTNADTVLKLNTRTKKWLQKCPLTGIQDLRKYVTKNDFNCYPKQASVKALGFSPYRKIRHTLRSSSPTCSFLAIPTLQAYFQQSRLKCFRTARDARKARYTKFVAPTPTPTATPDSEPLFPTPTATPFGNSGYNGPPLNFSFDLGPYQQGSGYTGHCTAVLNGTRTELSVHCTHNVTNASEAHLHVVPHNERSCALASPPLEFSMTCALTEDQAAGIAAGNGLLSIHLAPGAANQALAGLIRNP